MESESTENNKIKGKTEAQRLVDFVAPRYASWKKLTMTDKYWKNPNFIGWYKYQIMAANSLLRVYKYQDIIQALIDENMNWCSSLKYQGLIEVIQKIKYNRERKEALEKKPVKTQTFVEEEYVPATKKKINNLDKLRD